MSGNKYLALFRQRRVWQLLGVAVLAALIWYVGPQVRLGAAEPLASAWTRLVLILLLAALWTGPFLWSRWRARQAARALGDGLAGSTGQAAALAAADIAAMEQGFGQAITLLKQRHKGRHDFSERYLYEVPWYLIIGPPGIGKTTLISNSELTFILEKELGRKPIAGSTNTGTRNCDWFFTSEAILLDTAGRYTTQDSLLQADAGAWLGLLDLLKRHRRRQPINGLLVAVSLPDLIDQSAQQRRELAGEIRQRIDELHQRLGVRFPIYFLLTKCDLMAGFNAFFDRLGQEQRAQVWGATLPLVATTATANEGELGTRARSELDLLLGRLSDQMLQRLSEEVSLDWRAAIFAFPQQLATVRTLVADFVGQVFNPNPFKPPAPLLRGLYLTSATQIGDPIDRLMESLSRRYGVEPSRLLSRAHAEGRSYFINDLFRKVMFPEAPIVGTDPRTERRRRWLHLAAYAAILCGSVLAVLAWTWSYTGNQAAIAEVRAESATAAARLAEVQTVTDDLAALAPPLTQLARAAERFPESAPWSMGFLLYQGDKVRRRAADAYHKALTAYLLPGIGEQLRSRLRRPAGPEASAAALKAYLMLCEPGRLDAAWVGQVMQDDWAERYPGDPALRAQLARHLAALLALQPVPLLPEDGALVRSVRERLTQTPRWQVIYDRIKADAGPDGPRSGPKGYQLRNLIGDDGERVFTSTLGDLRTPVIPGLYTIEGLQHAFRPQSRTLLAQAAADAWVYGIPPDQEDQDFAELVEELNGHYADDYLAAWRKALDSLHIRPATTIRGLTEAVNGAQAQGYPLRQVVVRVAEETQPAAATEESLGEGKSADTTAAAASAAAVAASMNTRLQVWRQRVMKLERAARQAGIEPDLLGTSTATALRRVDDSDYFKRLRDLTVKRRNDQSELDAQLEGLDKLFEHLNNLQQDSNPDQAAYVSLTEQLQGANSPTKDLLRSARNLPDPVRVWITAIAKGGNEAFLGVAQKALDELWRDQVLSVCRSAIEGRYPFDRTAASETKLGDFKGFFGPGGTLDSFFKTHLARLVDTSKSPWRWRAVEGHGFGGSAGSLEQLERAGRIRTAFFGTGGSEPGMELAIIPKALDNGSLKFTLNIDGQQVEYDQGPVKPVKVRWPAPNGAGYARLEFLDRDHRTTTLAGDGDWAWFRLLDQAGLHAGASRDLVTATFTKDGHTMTIEIRANSVFNPLQLQDLAQFRCVPL